MSRLRYLRSVDWIAYSFILWINFNLCARFSLTTVHFQTRNMKYRIQNRVYSESVIKTDHQRVFLDPSGFWHWTQLVLLCTNVVSFPWNIELRSNSQNWPKYSKTQRIRAALSQIVTCFATKVSMKRLVEASTIKLKSRCYLSSLTTRCSILSAFRTQIISFVAGYYPWLSPATTSWANIFNL